MQDSKRVGTRATAGSLAALVVAVLFVTAQPVAAGHYTNTNELTGSTNTGVAISWSKAVFATTATEVLLGRDDMFPDSLASGAMQGSRPLLLTNSQTLSSDTNAELDRLRPSTVNILGGTSAVSAAIENELKAKYTVRRFSGPTRIETAIDIARRALPTATSAILAAAFSPNPSDQTRAFADSIAAGGWAADRNMPVLLTESERLSTATKNYLRGDGALIRTIFVVGGTSAISDAAVTEMQQLGITVRRISGPTRFDTAVRIAVERGYSDASKAAEVILTEGQAADSWAAGFAAAAYSASKDAPIVLGNGTAVPQPTLTWLSPSASAAATKLLCAPRLATQACDAASEAMDHTPVTGTMPRLLSATAGTPANGLRPVSFKFSEPLAVQITGGNLALYTYDALRATPSSVALDPAQPDTVIAQFADVAFGEYTIAAVAQGAVRAANTALNNPEGSVGLQSYNRSFAQTRGPRLSDVDPVDTDGTEWVVEFTFDRDLASCGAKNLFVLVEAQPDGSETAVDSNRGDGSGAAEREGMRSCLVEFVGMESTPASDFDDEIGRAIALEGAATAATGHVTVPTAIQVTAGTQAGPVLTSISISGDVATFNFDKDIDAAIEGAQTTLASRFHVFDSQGRKFDGLSAAINATGSVRQVNVTFQSGELRNVIVTGRVDEGAVKTQPTVTGTTPDPGTFNGEGAAYVTGNNTFDRVTAVPALTAVARTVSGSNATLRYTFAGPVDVSGSAGRFVVYDANAVRTELTSCSEDASTTPEDVTCTGNQTASAAQFNAIRDAVYAGATRDAYRPDGQGGDALEDSLTSPEAGRLLS